MTTRFILSDRCFRIEERTRILKTHKGPDGRIDETASDGWWIVLKSGISYRVGSTPPQDYEDWAGEPVNLVIERTK